jgi:hypothetical protein
MNQEFFHEGDLSVQTVSRLIVAGLQPQKAAASAFVEVPLGPAGAWRGLGRARRLQKK